VKDQAGDQRGGDEREPNKILSQETGLHPMFKTPNKTPEKKVMKNTNQQDINDPHEGTKLAEEE
jgi:hypothetical protein